MFSRIRCAFSLLILLTLLAAPATAQPPSWTIDLLNNEKKPEQFAERKLGSERMAEKKFNLYRRVVQNTFTHFNYYYNANNKINLVLERAKNDQQDDYAKLLSYYPYTLEATAAQKTELDSVILKATAGILLHDLRNDWIDNMYLLLGKAYFLRKDFDTAAATFQFINYNLFPRKKNEDGNRVVGTTDEAAGNRISIANKEKQNFLQKLAAQPPSRNDALVWLARTLIEQDEMGDAASLIHTLQNDPNLPRRLLDDLNDVNGYWFFKQGIYDSAAVYLEKGLTSAANKQDQARAEFLLGQLYERSRQFEKATRYYNLSSVHTTNALMDIHAQMNNAKMRKGTNPEELDNGINNLLKLGKKDRFEPYRDVLYFSAADIAMQKPDTNQAVDLFNRSLKYNESNISYKNKAFLQLAEIAYNRKQYRESFRMYDSLQSGDTTLGDQLEKIQDRRNALQNIVDKINIIEKQDSLLRIAALDPAAREAFVKKLAKKLRKERGLKEEDLSGGNEPISFEKDNSQPRDLFATDRNSGEWYFYNKSTRAKGFNDFKRKWGARTNTDNWRRKSAMGGAAANNRLADNVGGISNMNPDEEAAPDAQPISGNKDNLALPGKNDASQDKYNRDRPQATGTDQAEDISYEGLMANLPLTEDRVQESNALIAVNLFALGELFQNSIEDYSEAIQTYETSLKRFPDSLYEGALYANLSYCYEKLGMKEKAAHYRNLLNQQFSGSKAAGKLKDLNTAKTGTRSPEATQRYEQIYSLFIEGRFEEALAQKKMADSLYGNSYWTPQLLYIEAVYHVKQQQDSLATAVLGNIVQLYPKSPLKPKAERMIDVLARRKEIEEYLNNLQITRYPEDSITTDAWANAPAERKPMVRNDSNLISKPIPIADTIKTLQPGAVIGQAATTLPAMDTLKAHQPVVSGPYVFKASAEHQVIMLLEKVDITYVNETKNAFSRYAADNFRQAGLSVTKDTLSRDYAMILFTQFPDAEAAMVFLEKAKKAAPDEVSWLPPAKYSFLLIDRENLERLRATRDISGYRELLRKQYPGKF